MPNLSNTTFNAGLAYSEFQTRHFALILAAFTAFLASSFFIVGYFAGDVKIWQWGGEQWVNGLLGATLVAVMTLFQMFLYSSGDVADGKRATVIATIVAVLFGLMSEIGQGMEREEARMRMRSQDSSVFKATVGKIEQMGSAPAGNPYAAQIAAAMAEKAKAEQMLRSKDCKSGWCKNTYQGKADAAQAKADAYQSQSSADIKAHNDNVTNLVTKAKELETDEDMHHPLLKFLRGGLGISSIVSSFLLSLLIIGGFEYAFHYIGGEYARCRATLVKNGFDVTRRRRHLPRLADGSPHPTPTSAPGMAFAAARDVAHHAAETVADELIQAQAQRDRNYTAMGKWLGAPTAPSNRTQNPLPADPPHPVTAPDEPHPPTAPKNRTGAVGAVAPEVGAVTTEAHPTAPEAPSESAEELSKLRAELQREQAEKVRLLQQREKLISMAKAAKAEKEAAAKAAAEAATVAEQAAQGRAAVEAQAQRDAEANAALSRAIEAAKADAARQIAAAKAAAEQAEAAKREAQTQAKQAAAAKAEADREAAAAKVRAEQAEAEKREAKAQAEREATAKADAERQAREAAIAKAHAEAEAAERTRIEQRTAELAGHTEEQVRLAAEMLTVAIRTGAVTSLGFTACKPHLDVVGAPRNSDAKRTLHKLTLTHLAGCGVVKAHPEPGNGKPDYIIP